MIIGLAGQGRALVDEVPHSLVEGSAVYLAHGSVLRLENLADEPLRYLIVKAEAP